MAQAATRGPMVTPSGEPVEPLLTLASGALGVSQEGLGKLLGVSRRTVSRWVTQGGAIVLPDQLATLARSVYPVDVRLAARLAAVRGETLESLGIAPAPPSSPAYLVDVVVCAAAEALDASPRLVRPALLAALERAREAGLSVDAMANALRPPPAPKVPASKKQRT